MVLISIQEQERPQKRNGWNAIVRFDNGPKHSITVSNPFSKKEEEELEWYFEEHLKFPFTKRVRAQKAAASVKTYGEELFKQVFAKNANVLVAYRTVVQSGLNNVQIEIEGSPNFHALHWEALKDPELADPLAVQATMVRKNLVPSIIQTQIRSSPTINLLVVTARPSGKRDVGYRTISRPLVEALRQTNIPIQIDILRPGTYRALENHLRDITAKHGEGYYHVIHFDMHGAVLTYEEFQQIQDEQKDKQEPKITPYVYKPYGRDEIQPFEGARAFLAFEDEKKDTSPDLVESTVLANLLAKKHHIPITILNACQSGRR
jgi:hypothetical protein